MNDSANSPANPARRRRRSRTPWIVGILVVLAGGTWYGVREYRAKASEEGAYIFAPVETGDIEDLVSATGTLQPRDYVDVGAQVSGQIEDIFVEVGDEVTEGQKLATIDATTSQARVDANTATMESAKLNLLTAQANLDKATRDLERQKNLFKDDATTKETLLNAQTTYDNAVRSVETSKRTIQQQEANQRIENNNLKYTTIVAPISGTVMSIAVKKGQTINASQQAPNVLRIANLGTMTVQSDVSEADVSRLYKTIPVYFTTLSGGNRRWTSVMKRLEPMPKTQNGVVLYNALFDINNEGNTLKVASTAQVYFIAAEARNVLKVPMAALQQGQQISRELAKKAKDGNQPAAPGAAAGAAGSAINVNGARAANAAPATTPAAGGAAPVAPTVVQGNRPNGANGQAANAGGQRPGGQGGNFGGQRPGGQGGNFGGQRPGGGFGGGQFTPEQLAEFRRMREQGGGGGNFGGFNRQGMAASAGAAGGTAAGPRPVQRRRGTVMVKKADGTLEARQVVYGVSDRVFGEVLEGLKEGEQVVVGKHEAESAAAPRPANQNQNQNFQQGNRNFQGGGGFPGGGRPF